MGDFDSQVKDVLAFFADHHQAIRRLCRIVGYGGAVLDFAVRWDDSKMSQSETLSADLVQAAGKFGMTIQVSHYRVGA